MGTRLCKRHYRQWFVLSLALYPVPYPLWAADQDGALTTEDKQSKWRQLGELDIRASREQTPEIGEQIHPFRGFATRRSKDWSCALNYGGPESVIARSETRPLITYQGGKDEI